MYLFNYLVCVFVYCVYVCRCIHEGTFMHVRMAYLCEYTSQRVHVDIIEHLSGVIFSPIMRFLEFEFKVSGMTEESSCIISALLDTEGFNVSLSIFISKLSHAVSQNVSEFGNKVFKGKDCIIIIAASGY